ncbi:MAG: hypothetical protein LH702_02700 [Phormidesmis sp. CAN_BIN44]|nr:hypothetical protein [Phormidesmis sp. CAN_BIN44]
MTHQTQASHSITSHNDDREASQVDRVAVLLAFTTGTLIRAIVEEIIPEAHQTQDTNGQL